VEAGIVCALCGPSGSGKSTVVALLQRFYDPQSGAVFLDGVEVRSLNLKWLRQQIGSVGQEPVLFEGTVADNIAYGKAGPTRAEIEEAAQLANAHAFILNDLGDGYETQVGLRGSCRAGKSSVWPSRARWCASRPSCCSTRPPRRWTTSRRRWCRSRWTSWTSS
jgi:ATP-binding cassette subfamily B (MDR/TAP) protein 1